MAGKPNGQRAGIGVDAFGNQTIDPTENVKALTIAESKRQDDLRAKDREISDIKHAHQTEIATLRALSQDKIDSLREEYQEKIAHAESGRLDSIRQVDREEVAKRATEAQMATTTLAKQTNDLAITMAKTVTDTAQAAEARNSAQYSDINKRISALELAFSANVGKQQVADPMMAELLLEVKSLRESRAVGTGVSEGGQQIWGYIFGVVGMIAAVVAIIFKVSGH